MSEAANGPLAPKVASGRAFSGRRKVRLGDVGVDGRLRFDALTRYTQDVSDDDTTDAGLDPEPGWVVRSTVVDEVEPARLGESLEFVTFCSGLGSRWAERRLTVTGQAGARYEVATIWVCVDPGSGRPHRLTEQFDEIYGPAAAGRKVSARLTNPGPARAPGSVRALWWQLRRADLDVYAHVNNAAYWAVVEEVLPAWHGPRRTRMEYGQGLAGVERVRVLVEGATTGPDDCPGPPTGGPIGLWWMAPSDGGADGTAEGDGNHGRNEDGDGDGDGAWGEPVASARIADLPEGLYP